MNVLSEVLNNQSPQRIDCDGRCNLFLNKYKPGIRLVYEKVTIPHDLDLLT